MNNEGKLDKIQSIQHYVSAIYYLIDKNYDGDYLTAHLDYSSIIETICTMFLKYFDGEELAQERCTIDHLVKTLLDIKE